MEQQVLRQATGKVEVKRGGERGAAAGGGGGVVMLTGRRVSIGAGNRPRPSPPRRRGTSAVIIERGEGLKVSRGGAMSVVCRGGGRESGLRG
jgi:hypothetical protein